MSFPSSVYAVPFTLAMCLGRLPNGLEIVADVENEKVTTYVEHITSKQDTETDSLISEDFTLEVVFLRYFVMRTL